MFFRCSGVDGIEEGGDEGAKVGEDVSDCDDGGNIDGSKSRSGIGGDRSGRLVILTIRRRNIALLVHFILSKDPME